MATLQQARDATCEMLWRMLDEIDIDDDYYYQIAEQANILTEEAFFEECPYALLFPQIDRALEPVSIRVYDM